MKESCDVEAGKVQDMEYIAHHPPPPSRVWQSLKCGLAGLAEDKRGGGELR
ncbi:MAG: hypothetical protein ACYS76_08415 [Planctomycetota bacterium]